MFESTAEKTEKKVNVKDMTVIALVTAWLVYTSRCV